eukprot:jgi/Tetstr1/430369/TSEL_020182.t1
MPCKSAGSAAAAVAGAAMAGAAAYLWWTIRPAPPPGRRKLQGYALTLAELAGYDGQDGSKPTLVAIRNQIYDVSSRPDMYGPEGSYPFAGKEIARALAKMSVKAEDCTSDLAGLTAEELDVLRDWEEKFTKYPVVGRVIG